MASWFFFSYARDDRDDFLKQFYSDLCQKIRLAYPLRADEVGFIDEGDIELADKWDNRLAEALRTCRVLVSICSPNYFRSEYCGKEFQVCLDRQAKLSGTSTAIFPVIWGMPTGSVHRCMKKFQYTHGSLPKIYAQEGLRYFIDLNKYADDYKEFVTRLAQAIVKAGTSHPLPDLMTLESIDEVPNAFAENGNRIPIFQRNAFFSYVAGKPHELSEIPRNLRRDIPQRYGRGGRDWRPFYPEYLDSVGNVAVSVTASQNLYPQEFPVDKNLVRNIEKAEKDREIVILLVDPWSIRIKTYRDVMKAYDKTNFENCAVLVAWNSLIKTRAQRKKLQAELEDVFKFRAQFQKPVYYIDSISSDQDLRDTLSRTMVKLQNNLIERSKLQRGIKQSALGKKARQRGIELRRQPIITGPGDRRR